MLPLLSTKYKSCPPWCQPSNYFILFNVLQLFQLFTQHMSVSHGHSTMGGIGGGSRQKKGESLTSTRQINEQWRCSSIDINVSE